MSLNAFAHDLVCASRRESRLRSGDTYVFERAMPEEALVPVDCGGSNGNVRLLGCYVHP